MIIIKLWGWFLSKYHALWDDIRTSHDAHRPITPENVFQNKYKTIYVKLHHVKSFLLICSAALPPPLPSPHTPSSSPGKKKNPLAGKWFLSVRYTHTIHIYISHTQKEEDNGSFRSCWHYFTPSLCRHK